ncbi:MAG: hypothetical protein NZ744_15420, partial [Pirellulaceae bacterium]|nr:hypothetical protein [Pirellulaceae bacterium]
MTIKPTAGNISTLSLFAASAVAFLLLSAPVHAQAINIVEMLDIGGTVESVGASQLVIKDTDGKTLLVRVQGKTANAVVLENGQRLRYPATVEILGSMDLKNLGVGQSVRLTVSLNRQGNSQGEVAGVELALADTDQRGISLLGKPPAVNEYAQCVVIGQFIRVLNQRMVVRVPEENGFTRKTTLSFALAADAKVTFVSDDIKQVVVGGKVTQCVAARLNTGDIVAKQLRVEVSKYEAGLNSLDAKLYAKYQHLSDDPQSPRLIRSPHFAFMTDISDREGQVILHKLETMVTLLSKYFGRAPTSVINGFIVQNLDVWPQGVLKEPEGVAKIRAHAGICFNSSLGNQRRAELYSCDDHGVIQHECTHGYCHVAFGSTGPTWLAEGVAELGQYWKFGEQEVSINPSVISYLTRTPRKKSLLEIAVPGRVPAGGWQDYAWRWALCNLLANNPNYSPRFKPLAIALMEQREGVSFQSVYGQFGNRLSFEYRLFIEYLGNGFRPDLCAWQWGAKFKRLSGEALVNKKIK